jgi:hypothetical protein
VEKMTQVIAILTGKDLNILQSEGGVGYWIINEERVKKGSYIILIRNHRESWAVKDDGLGHGQAFMLAKVSGCISTDKMPGRKIIQISDYSLLANIDKFKKAWKKLTNGQRYPIAYLNTDDLLRELEIDVNLLNWEKFNTNSISKDLQSLLENIELPEIIKQFKEIISNKAGINIDKVDIKINF